MDSFANACPRWFEMAPLDAEDAIQAVIPLELATRHVELPRAHVAGRQGQRAPLLAASQPFGLRLKLGGTRGDPFFELRVQYLELARLAIELDEHLDLGAQHLGHDRHSDIVDGAD